MRVLIAGGGIGGLAAALCLHEAGLDVRVCESVREPRELGVGINLQPAAVRELVALGLGDDLERIAIATAGLRYYSKHGKPIWSEPRGREAGFDWPQYSIHRGQLLMLLYRAAQERLGPDRLRTGHQLVSFEQDPEGVTATFRDRRAGGVPHTERGDVLIGADGIHSTVRAAFYPEEGPPRFGGQLMWRAAVEAPPFLDGRTMVVVGHRDQKLVAYPMARRPGGRVLTNWLTELTVPGDTPPVADWNRRVDRDVFAARFADWTFPWLDVPALIAATPEVFEFPKVDRDPIPRWTFGRVTLLGDAAHPMHPSGSQAGSQAIVDAAVLARALGEDGAGAGLQRYEAERLPAMRDVTLRNRRLGPEEMTQVVEERAPDGFADVEDVISRREMEELTASFSRTAGLDRDTLNATTPIVAGLRPAAQG
jgi:2-polyprenyl-6-methoxyphenol hydroxylase-like FAD-dependent oxidoreductase